MFRTRDSNCSLTISMFLQSKSNIDNILCRKSESIFAIYRKNKQKHFKICTKHKICYNF